MIFVCKPIGSQLQLLNNIFHRLHSEFVNQVEPVNRNQLNGDHCSCHVDHHSGLGENRIDPEYRHSDQVDH